MSPVLLAVLKTAFISLLIVVVPLNVLPPSPILEDAAAAELFVRIVVLLYVLPLRRMEWAVTVTLPPKMLPGPPVKMPFAVVSVRVTSAFAPKSVPLKFAPSVEVMIRDPVPVKLPPKKVLFPGPTIESMLPLRSIAPV